MVFTADEIRQRVEAVAARIAADLEAIPELLVLGVLNGSIIFLADLVRRLPMRVRYDMIRASSYRGARSSGDVRIESFPDAALIAGRDVLLVDDILDTGRTLGLIGERIRAARPQSLHTAVLVTKRVARAVPVEVDYSGFEIDEGFVVGYGLDYEGRYRDLPYIGLLKREAQP